MTAKSSNGVRRDSSAGPPPSLGYFVLLVASPILMSVPMFVVGFGAILTPESRTPPLVPLSIAGFMVLSSAAIWAFLLSFQKFKVRHRVLSKRFPKAIVVSTINSVDRWAPEITAGAVKENKSFSATADEAGLTFWGGHKEPSELLVIPWREIAKVSVTRYEANGYHFPAIKVEGKAGRQSVTMPSFSIQPLRLQVVDRTAHQALAQSLETLRLGAISDSQMPHL